jgi:hypothetical protein
MPSPDSNQPDTTYTRLLLPPLCCSASAATPLKPPRPQARASSIGEARSSLAGRQVHGRGRHRRGAALRHAAASVGDRRRRGRRGAWRLRRAARGAQGVWLWPCVLCLSLSLRRLRARAWHVWAERVIAAVACGFICSNCGGRSGRAGRSGSGWCGTWRPSACACTAARSTRPQASGRCCTSRSPRGRPRSPRSPPRSAPKTARSSRY